MSRTFEDRLAKNLFPPMSDSFARTIDDTLRRLKNLPLPAKKTRGSLPAARIATAATALLIAIFGCTFALRPALAANIPLINGIVYVLAPKTQADQDTCQAITEVISAALNRFASGSTADIGEQLRSGDDWVLNEDTLMAAYYLQYLAVREQLLFDSSVQFDYVTVRSLTAEAKAFCYTADVAFDLVMKDDVRTSETARVCLEETTDGFSIVSIEMRSPGFTAYEELIGAYAAEYGGGNLDEHIATYNAYLLFNERQHMEAEQHRQSIESDGLTATDREKIKELEQLIEDVRAADMPEADKQRRIADLEAQIQETIKRTTPENRTMEDLAAELMYRYYTVRQTGIVPELGGLVERNEDTDLLFYDLQLTADKAALGYFIPLVTVEKGYGEILEVLEEDADRVKLSMYVKTVIDGGVGEEMILTYRKDADGYIITGYDRITGDGTYRIGLKPLAKRYMDEGYPSAEANRLAYEDLLNEAEQFAREHPDQPAGRP